MKKRSPTTGAVSSRAAGFVCCVLAWTAVLHGWADAAGSNVHPDISTQDIWTQCGWELALAAGIILVQAGAIGWLLYERRRRHLTDATSRQRLAELVQVNRYSAAGELTISIAHELNQSLGSILTNTETAELLLKNASPDLAAVKEILADIRRDDLRASEVIRRLRGVLKKAPFEIGDIDLNETVREAIGFVTALANRSGVTLKFAAASSEPRVKADQVQLQQVIINLILNAVDAISEAGAKKREITVSTNGSKPYAEIRVGDSGPGIGAGEIKSVFDRFFTTKPQGMGMGLAVARTIVEAHQGQISAENQAAGGALFIVKLPVSRQPALA